MTPRLAPRLALALWAATVVVVVGFVTLTFLNRSHPGGDVRAGLMFSSILIAFATIGELIVARRNNAIGWIFLGAALAMGMGSLGEQYSLRATLEPGSIPAPEIAAWLQLPNTGGLGFAPFPLLFLLFPTGRPAGPRWRLVLWQWWAGVILILVGLVFRPGAFNVRFGPNITNPLGVDSLDATLRGAVIVGAALLFASAPPAVVALVLRFRRATGAERQQLKWLAGIAMIAAVLFVGMLATAALPRIGHERTVNDLFYMAFAVTLVAGTPLAVAIAILRHRLWDIDRLINRTAVYGLLTVLLGSVYAAVVLVPGLVVGSGSAPTGLVAGATLAVAAIFGPARRWIQAFIDRRFYRRRYDAARTVEAFSARLRDEVDLDALVGDLLGVVRETMQPVHASLWIRSAGGPSAPP